MSISNNAFNGPHTPDQVSINMQKMQQIEEIRIIEGLP
jgi:hypothetical protein